jgi:hypothetical protein
MSRAKVAKFEEFERAVVFRSARFLPLLLSLVATLMLAGSAIMLLYSIVPSSKPDEPAPVAEPAQVTLTSSDVNDFLNQSNRPTPQAQSGDNSAGNSAPAPEAAPVHSNEAVQLATELDKLQQRTNALNLPWANQYQTECSEIFFGNCIGQRTVMSVRGVGGFLEQAFSHHNEGTMPVEHVQMGNQIFHIDPNQANVKLAIIRELEGVLAAAAPADAHKVISAWSKLREDKEEARAQAFQNEKERTMDAYAKEQEDYQANTEKKHMIRNQSVSALGMALGAFVILGLILAVLAIERHTRLLEAQRTVSIESAPLEVVNS